MRTLWSLTPIALTVLLANPARAEDKILYVGSYGGSYETIMKQQVIPPFEKATGVHVDYVSGNSSETLAKIQAQRGHEDLDLAIIDDGPMYQAKALGLCAKLKPGANAADIYDLARMGDDAVATGVVAVGLAYDARAFEKAGWKPPASWADLVDKKFERKVAIPGIDNTYGLVALLMYAKQNGGGTDQIDPGFTYLAKQVAPNVRAFESSPGRMSELFQSGEVSLAIWGSGRVNALADTGFPIKFVYPKEGAAALLIAACVVNGAPHEAAAQAFLDYLLSPDVQKLLAAAGNGPVNKKVQLAPDLAARLPYGPEEISKLVAFDWSKINPKRDEWTKRWNREIER